MVQYAWFKPTAAVELDIVCAELCGWGHYKMNARLRIVSRVEFEQWIEQQQDRIKAPVLNPAGEPSP
jgi:cytochrome c oxidase subunit 2